MNPLAPLSNRNPQLWREAKERLKPRNLLATAALAIAGQALLFASYSKPPMHPIDPGFMTLAWQFQLFHALTWINMLLLLVLGCYLLVHNLAKEAKRGTLMFLQLTPISAGSVLLGKLLGVPILLYWTIALTLPLQVRAALKGGVAFMTLAAVYFTCTIACVFAYLFAAAYALGWGAKAQTWYMVVLSGALFLVLWLPWQIWGFFAGRDYDLPFLPIAGVICMLLGAAIVLLWRMAVKRFRHPPRLYSPSNGDY